MRPVFSALIILVLASIARAQHSNGYVFIAPGGASCCGYTAMTLHMGIGGEAVLGHGIGIGAEIGALAMRQDFADSALGVFSPNGYFHLMRGDHRADPFVTGGYTVMFRSGHINLFNFGGGLNYWFAGRLGARLEFRDHVHTNLFGPTIHYWGARFGLAFH